MEDNKPCQGRGERHRLWALQGKGSKKHQIFCPENLNSWQDGDMGVACSLMAKGGSSFPWGRGYYPEVGVCRGVVSLNSHLAPDHLWLSCCVQIHNRKPIFQVEAVTQSYLWDLSVSNRDPLKKL